MKSDASRHDVYEEAGHFAVFIDGLRYLVPRHCPHRAGRLDHGYVNERRRTVTCPLHHSTFCLQTGTQLAGPACGPLAMHGDAVEVQRADAAVPGNASFREDSADALL